MLYNTSSVGTDDSTILLTDVNVAMRTAQEEAAHRPAALVVVGGNLNETLFDLDQEVISVGRGANNEICLNFSGISRNHFKIIKSLDSMLISDAGSKNGTYINNEKITSSRPLKKGDVIKVGSVALRFIPQGDPDRLTYDKLNLRANMDLHTGCFNKTYFNEILKAQVKKSQETGTPLSLIIFDLDHFKRLNDDHGHDAGDAVLKQVAQTVKLQGLRENDIFARYGGEEFVILLPGTNLKHAYNLAERLRKFIESHRFVYGPKVLPVTISVGLSDYRRGVSSGTDLFKRADQAVYKAKKGGRNQVQFFRAN